MATITVDSRGSACPGPITDLARAYKGAANGDVIELLATDEGIKSDAKAWCDRTGNQLVSIDEKDGVYTVEIKIMAKK
ncbi:MAG: sulfurtransferase TusA family protein [Candidatus Marsarchaeota archaeon]|jgi:TusA-related sulfurtransferase|nr:sulfurtransferase TusA family protein [Candidatus Marsarchaeota archaeon]